MGVSTYFRAFLFHSLVCISNARIETLMSYAQSVYLLFASVYVCKETVEHLLLSSGEEAADGHHHHHSHEDVFGCVFISSFCAGPY